MSSPVDALKALQFFSTIGTLKTLKRTGWVDNEVSLPESVADHMYRMTMMCFALSDSSVDKMRLVKICLCHDLAEAIAGDITPTEHSGVSKEKKRKLEEDALETIVQDLDGCGALGSEIRGLWYEYEERSTAESKLASQLDKFEMIVQADEYEKQHAADGKRLESFFSYTEGYFTHPEVGAWDKALRAARDERWAKCA